MTYTVEITAVFPPIISFDDHISLIYNITYNKKLTYSTVRAVRENIKPRSCCIDLAVARFDIFPYSPHSQLWNNKNTLSPCKRTNNIYHLFTSFECRGLTRVLKSFTDFELSNSKYLNNLTYFELGLRRKWAWQGLNSKRA